MEISDDNPKNCNLPPYIKIIVVQESVPSDEIVILSNNTLDFRSSTLKKALINLENSNIIRPLLLGDRLPESNGRRLHFRLSPNTPMWSHCLVEGIVSNDNSTFSENRLQRIALRAKENGAVRLIDLIYLMAEEENYSDLLFGLWDSYDLNSEDNNLMPQNICDDISLRTKQGRAGVWWWLFARLVVTSEGRFYFKKLPELIPLFSLYYDVECKRKVEDINDRSEDCYVKLNHIVLGFERIEKNHGLNVPLPSRLFPDRRADDSITPRQGIPPRLRI